MNHTSQASFWSRHFNNVLLGFSCYSRERSGSAVGGEILDEIWYFVLTLIRFQHELFKVDVWGKLLYTDRFALLSCCLAK